MSAWIKMRTDLRDDARVGRTADLAGVTDAAAIGAYYIIWAFADTHTTSGKLGLTLERVDRMVGIQGFAKAASHKDVGWLAVDSAGLCSIPRFKSHNGATAKKRCTDAKRQEKHRGKESRPSHAPDVTKNGRDRELEQEHEQALEQEINPALHASEPEKRAAGGMLADACPEGVTAETARQWHLRKALDACKVSGKNLTLLSESKLTAEVVLAHWARISVDPTAKKPVSCLVAELKRAAGLSGSPAPDLGEDHRRKALAAQVTRYKKQEANP
jgi:hypothetical protein